jgi:c-di-GMP-binding flagellar brake protein YcgR
VRESLLGFEAIEIGGIECRTAPRHSIHEDATLTVVGQSGQIPCEVIDLSLGGCRLRAKEQCTAAPGAPVEVSFKVRGLPMLLPGVVRWASGSDENELVGVRFDDMSSRRKEALAEVIEEIEAMLAARKDRQSGKESN